MKPEVLYQKAHEAGMKAYYDAKPVPMVVKDLQTGQKWHESEGVCGFAYVVIKPARGKLVSYLKSVNKGYKSDYYGGYWVGPAGEAGMNQSLARKEAYCSAFAEVLTKAGVKCYTWSRLD